MDELSVNKWRQRAEDEPVELSHLTSCLMQHAGLQYGQGAATSHQSPPFAHADITQTNGGNTTSSLRQFRKKDGPEKSSTTDLNTSIENSHIARVAPHSHYPARPNDYYRYQHQYPDYK
ncbi:hypothetical protein GEV33_001316 [Tenebrio molitor]|uniref:Uncharacterized protein n=1 Tax=Tenebrio molitor TaxID=7067 RepID=A0A8J6HVG0_TENMO|nr:hypothetical protein GEV33_001316 [Tenebrio molitor]